MIHLSELLGKFKNLGLGERQTKDALIEAIQEIVGVSISRKDVSLSGKTAYIKTGSVMKSEIFLRKEEILKKMKEKSGGILNISDVR